MSRFPELYTIYQAKVARDNRKHDERMVQYNEKEKVETEAILSALEDCGVPRSAVQTNGYWFRFDHLGYRVSFVNQTGRLCVTVYLTPQDEEDEKMVGDIRSHDNNSVSLQIRNVFQYRDFIVNGSNFDITVNETIRRIYGEAQ